MKRTILFFGTLMLISSATFAQKKNNKTTDAPATTTTTTMGATSAPTQQVATDAANQNPDAHMKFMVEEHNFGTIPEGPSVSYDFEFKNIGKEPIVLSGVQASCGCTTPNWSKEPILPGKSSKITATYSTQGRPGMFTKTITVNSNVGSKILKITGTVEKAPDSSVPQNESSMMKH